MRPAFLGPPDPPPSREPRPSVALPAAVLAILAACALILAAGCTDVPAPTYCYNVASATIHSVDISMGVAGDLYRAGKLSDATRDKLVAAHDQYRPVAKLVVEACKAVSDQANADLQAAKLAKAAEPVLAGLVAAGAR